MTQTETPDYNAARYGGNFKQTCARGHDSTGRRCCACFGKTTRLADGWNPRVGELHHVRYWSWYRWLLDCADFVLSQLCPLLGLKWDRQPHEGVWGEVKGREWIGWDAFPLHWKCHQKGERCAHSRKHWIQSKRKPELFNKNRSGYRWRLRISWLILRLLAGRNH